MEGISVSTRDVEQVFRPLTDQEKVVAEGLLEQAARKLWARVPQLGLLIADDKRKQALAADAVVNAVKRVLMNPNAARQIQSTQGPFQESMTIDNAVSTGLLYIDPQDLVGLIPTAHRKVRNFHVQPGFHEPRPQYPLYPGGPFPRYPL